MCLFPTVVCTENITLLESFNLKFSLDQIDL